MIKQVKNRVWAFDAEWVPDPLAGHLVYGIEESVSEPAEVLPLMWGEGGATEEDPTPFLKLALCRVVSISAVERKVTADGQVGLSLVSLPRLGEIDGGDVSEAQVLGRFLDALGEHRPQLVGFNSIQSDLKILVQRGLILGLRAPGFCRRPDKPWEGVDYFARGSDWNIDLKDMLSGWGKGSPSLHELAVQCGIPGKMDVDGNQVARLWLDGSLDRIVKYNEFDALTTYLVWLRLVHFAGIFTAEQYQREQALLRSMLEARMTEPGNEHLEIYLAEWDRLRDMIVRHRGLL